ncbi:MAG: cell division protein FtsQ/DivIB [Betaproteobacteria bacterium]
MLPIRSVSFSSNAGELKHVDSEELKHIAGAIQNMGGSMLRTDLNQVRAAVKQVEWVRDAEVRRHFPSTLEVRIEEHAPFARWISVADSEQSFLVNTFGEVFEADIDEQVALPLLGGPKDSSREVMANYQSFKTQLAVIEQVPAEVRLSPRRAWQVRLDNGSTLELGRNDAAERLQRYVRAFPGINAIRVAGTRIDLRYQNGLAVRQVADKNTKKPATKS